MTEIVCHDVQLCHHLQVRLVFFRLPSDQSIQPVLPLSRMFWCSVPHSEVVEAHSYNS